MINLMRRAMVMTSMRRTIRMMRRMVMRMRRMMAKTIRMRMTYIP